MDSHGGTEKERQPGADYIDELQGLVALPDRMPCTLLEFARHIRTCIEEEQNKLMPNNALISTLCNAARLGYEQIELARARLGPRVIES